MVMRLADALAALEVQESQRAVLQAELDELDALATFGELAGPMVHEFNNLLNVLLLQVAVLEHTLPEGARADLAQIRRQGKSAAALISLWQHYRSQQQPAPQPLDLNEVVRAVVVAPNLGLVQLRLASDLPAVSACYVDARRLCTFLISNAVAVSAGNGSVQVCTEHAGGRVWLRVEDTGPHLRPEALHSLFEPAGAGREGTQVLELAACKSLVRRLRGKISAENRPEEGVAVVVELPAVNG